jgi:hypothetical protein
MPSKSPAQARLMAAAAHNPKFRKKVGVPQDVADDFNAADTGTGMIKPKKKFKKGGGQFTLKKEGRK